MPTYVPTDWVDNVTPVNAANMDKMEAGISAAVAGALPADIVVPSSTRIIANKLAGGDAQPICRLLGDGMIEWGPGGSAVPDTNLYRSGLNTLKTDDSLVVAGDLYANAVGKIQYLRAIEILPQGAAAVVYESAVTGDIGWRFLLKADGKMAWGTGANFVGDTNLYRYSASVLRTDTGFSAGGNIEGNAHVIVGDHLYWAAGPYDTSLYRPAAYTLRVSEMLEVSQSLSIGVSNNAYLSLKNDANAIYFGAAGDTNLYRSAANQLKTDDDFVASNLLTSGVYFGPPYDASFYRSAVATLRTDATFQVGGRVQLNPTGAGGDISFQGDTNLYRAGAANLKSDGSITLRDSLVIETGRVYIGASLDTSLYRSAAGQLKTDGQLYVADKIFLGVSSPVSLYKDTGSALRTDGSLNVGQTLTMAAEPYPTIRFGTPALQMYKQATSQLRVEGALSVATGTPTGGLLFGGSEGEDVNLYRSAANRLKTDDVLDATVLGLATKSKAGTPVDADWAAVPPVGTMVLDTTANKLWVRTATATWKGVVIA